MEFEIVRNDITEMKVDAIVLPANIGLRVGSGTSKAIFEKAGMEELKKECAKVPLSLRVVGSAVPTRAFKLNAKYIIHAIVPKWNGGNKNEYKLLTSAYISALKLADEEMNCDSIAFPLLGAGNNGFDIKIALQIAKKTIESYEQQKNLSKVFLVVYDKDTLSLVKQSGDSVEEFIDEGYILTNYENHDFFKEAKDEVGKLLENPLVHKLLKSLIKKLIMKV